MAWLFSGGWKFPSFEPTPNRILSDSSFVEKFNYIPELINACNIGSKELEKHPSRLYNEFIAGEYIFYMGNWEIRSLRNSRGEDSFSVMPIPVAGDDYRRWGGGSVLCVSAFSELPKLSWKLVEELTSQKNIEKFVEATGEVPSFKTKFWEKHKEDEDVNQVYKLIKETESYPIHPLWYKIEKILSEDITNYLWHVIGNPNLSTGKAISILNNTDQKLKKLLDRAW
jgi:maltose-binding protein MalE